ncbi:MAG: PAS domain S-box protein [Gemmatimonadetes bacterium]|nr:PAS domain S-box protein [Gemmatimonadota bacterium]
MDDIRLTAEFGRFYDLPFIGMAVTSVSSKRWLHVNQTLCELLGYPRDELVTKTWAELTHPEDLPADVAAFERVLRGEANGYKMDKRFIRKDGAVVHATIDVLAERLPDGSVDRCFATVADITLRVQAEATLRASSDLLAKLAKQVPGVIYQYRMFPDGRSCFPFASEAIEAIYEVTPDEVREDASVVFTRIHPDDLAEAVRSIRESERTLETWKWDYRVVLPRQGLRWRSGIARPERLPDGSTLWHGFISDSTERELAQAALAESEARLRVQIEHAPEAIVVLDADTGRFTDANMNALELFGLDRAALLLLSPVDLSPPVQSDGIPSAVKSIEYIDAALAGEAPVFEWTHRSSDGRDFPCELRLVRLPSSAQRLLRGSITDISARRAAQAELLRLNAAIASSMNGIAIIDLQLRVTYVNRSCLDLWGYRDASEVLGRHAADFFASAERAEEMLRNIEARGSDTGEMLAVRTDGATRTFQYNANAFAGADGTRIGMLASFIDVTERKRAEADLRLKDETIATSLSAILIADAEGKVVYANPAFVRLWGFADAGDVVGRSMMALGDPGARAATMAALMERGALQSEFSVRRQDGTPVDVVLAANVVRDADGRVQHIMASMLDVTESKKLQGQLLQSQKMQTVGRLAGGVAHDFNNLLTVMKGYLDLARLDLPADAPLARDLSEVDRAVDSASSLTQQLLAFSRKQIIDPRVLDLNESVTRMHAMLLRLLGEDIELRQTTVPDLGLVRFDPAQAEQILVNLAVNARDAMPDGGTLTLETSNVRLDELVDDADPDVEPGEYVMLAVSDTGVGMTPEVRSHLFEPFFTTKELGRGTGLGLPMVFGAVTQSHGRIEVYSEPGHGTTFKIYLPRVNPDASPRISPPLGTLPHGSETIAVVEDEDAIRVLAARVLGGLGYDVLAFRTGREALEALAEAPARRVDLLLTDVMMPEMKGRELADRLIARRPDLRVLFASGYTDDVLANQGVLDPGVDFLAKPYSTAVLARRVRTALDRPAPA